MTRLLYICTAICLLYACNRNDYEYYSGESRIQFKALNDSVRTKSFFYDALSIHEDTIWFTLQTTGYVSENSRSFRIDQVAVSDLNNAEEGLHYKPFSEMGEAYAIPPNATEVSIPVIILRDNLESRKTYYLQFEILENDFFKPGEGERLWRRIIISNDLLKPAAWNAYYIEFYWGDYSINKHEWMIEQTGKLWDETFMEEVISEPGAATYWKDKLNDLLYRYNLENPPLTDDDEIEIPGFPN